MKKYVLLLLVTLLCCGSAYSQTKKAPVKRASTGLAAKQKAEAEAKAKAEAEAAEMARVENNAKCRFLLDTGDFISQQGYDGYVIYEIPEMTASELKSAVYTTLTSMFKSPKDAITNVSDNIIQVEGYSPSLFENRTSSGSRVLQHLMFSLVIQFKNGKIRYNTPSLKYLHYVLENSNIEKTIEEKSDISNVNMMDYFKGDKDIFEKLEKIENYFNNILYSINSKLKQSNDW